MKFENHHCKLSRHLLAILPDNQIGHSNHSLDVVNSLGLIL